MVSVMIDSTVSPAASAAWAAPSRCRDRRHDPCLEFFFDTISRMPLLTASQEHELGYRAMAGNRDAQHTLISSNLRLVVMFARRFQGRGLSISDLIGFGSIGLLRAAKDYNPSRGVRFSTYASIWIKQAIRRSLRDTSRTIRLPVHIQEKTTAWLKAVDRLQNATGAEPEPADVAKSLGWTGRRACWAVLVTAALDCLVADEQSYGGLNDDGPMPWDVPAIDGDPAELAASAEWAARLPVLVAGVLGRLPGREADVLRMRFGLNGESPMTLRAVAARIGWSVESVRKWERAGLAKARAMLGDVGEVV